MIWRGGRRPGYDGISVGRASGAYLPKSNDTRNPYICYQPPSEKLGLIAVHGHRSSPARSDPNPRFWLSRIGGAVSCTCPMTYNSSVASMIRAAPPPTRAPSSPNRCLLSKVKVQGEGRQIENEILYFDMIFQPIRVTSRNREL